MSQLVVVDSRNNRIPFVTIRISEGIKPQELAVYDVTGKVDGSFGWPIPGWDNKLRTLYANVGDYANPKFGADTKKSTEADQNGDIRFVLPDAAGGVVVPPTPTGVGRLHRDGNDLRNTDNQIVRLEGASFFAAHWLLLERGPSAILPSLRELKSRYNANMVLVFGMSLYVQKNLFGADPFNPAKYGQRFFDSFAELFAILAQEGFYGYYPVFPDHGLLPEFDQDGKCVDHWNKLMNVARDVPNLLLKPTNEGASKGYNYINPHLLSFPDFCPVAACDYGVDDPAYATGEFPSGSDWGGDRTFGDLHPPREERAPAVVLDCTAVNNIYYKHSRGLAISEAVRLGSNGSAGANRELARLVGLASRVGNLMRVFHSLQGEKCEVFDDVTRDHADAYFTGL